MIAEPERAAIYIKAAIALRNLLRTTESSVYCPPGFLDSEDGMGNSIPGRWREEEQPTGLNSVSRTSSNWSVHLIIYEIMHVNSVTIILQVFKFCC